MAILPDIFALGEEEKVPAEIDAAECFRVICERWEDAIRTLALEFQAGVATVTPKDPPATCKFCAFPALCRIAEIATPLTLAEEDVVDE